MLFDHVRPVPLTAPASVPIIVYGTRWCAKTMMLRRYLDRMNVRYSFIDLDTNPAALSQLKWLTGGYAFHPTVYVGGQVLIEPDFTALKRAIVNAAVN